MRATTSAPAVSISASSSSRLASVSSSSVPGNVTPTSTMRSRIVRSMRVAPSASLYGLLTGVGSRSCRRRWPGRSDVTRPGSGRGAPLSHRPRPCAPSVPRWCDRRGPSRWPPRPPRAAPVPHASVMPAPRSWTRIVMASRSGPGSMISRLMSGTWRPRARRSTPATSSTATTVCGLPRSRWATGRSGLVPMAAHPDGSGELADRAHVDAGEDRQRVLGRAHLDAARAGVGEDRLLAEVAAPAARWRGRSTGCRCRSSRPGCRRRCTAPSGRRSRRPACRPAGRRRRCRGVRWHSRRASAGRSSSDGVEHDEEVVAEAVVLGERESGHACSAAITTGASSATGSRSTSTQRTRGSRRNHRSCRTANWRVRSTVAATASSSVARPRGGR